MNGGVEERLVGSFRFQQNAKVDAAWPQRRRRREQGYPKRAGFLAKLDCAAVREQRRGAE
jgi:hypothetical protein